MKRVIYIEPIYCMAQTDQDTKLKLTTWVNPDPNRSGDPYFKIYSDYLKNRATYMARIKFLSPERVYHKSDEGKLEWELNSKIKKNLIRYMNMPSNLYAGNTRWDVTKFLWNNELDLVAGNVPKGYTSKIDAYVDGYYDKQNKGNPSYVSSEVEIPDYTLLEN